MVKSDLLDIVNKFDQQKVVLAGDVMLDVSEIGKIRKISPEDACFVVSNPKINYYLGGAGNVFANIQSLGGDPFLCGVVGDDENGVEIAKLLSKKYNCSFPSQGLAVIPGRQTTVKRRSYIDGGHYIRQVGRTDFEDLHEISNGVAYFIINNLEANFEKSPVSVIAISDYDKGFLTSSFVNELFSFAKRKNAKVIIDPKPLSGGPGKLKKYEGCYGFKPNLSESETISGIKYDGSNINDIGKKCLDILKPEGFVIVTCGKEGIYIFNAKGNAVDFVPGKEVEVSDITGAGDTVLSALSLSLSAGSSLIDAAAIANLAAAEKVKKRGTATVSRQELVDVILKM